MTDPVWWFFLIWLPDFFKKTYGLNIKKSWVHLVTIYIIITVLSIFGGWITGFFIKKGWTITQARKTGMFLFALCVVPVAVATKLKILAGRIAHCARGLRAPGLVGEPLYHGIGHVS